MSGRFDTKKRDERGAAKTGLAPEKTIAIIVIGITSRDRMTKGVMTIEDEIEKGNEKETTTIETDIATGIETETVIEIVIVTSEGETTKDAVMTIKNDPGGLTTPILPPEATNPRELPHPG